MVKKVSRSLAELILARIDRLEELITQGLHCRESNTCLPTDPIQLPTISIYEAICDQHSFFGNSAAGALRIQREWRAALLRRQQFQSELANKRTFCFARRIQAWWRAVLHRVEHRKQVQAAVTIQRAWFSHKWEGKAHEVASLVVQSKCVCSQYNDIRNAIDDILYTPHDQSSSASLIAHVGSLCAKSDHYKSQLRIAMEKADIPFCFK